MKFFQKKGGLSILGIFVLGFILIFVLSYFKISIKDVAESPEAKSNVGYVQEKGQGVWDSYLKKPATYFWDEIVVNIFWKSFINNMERVRDGKPTNYEEAAPSLPLGNNAVKTTNN